MPYDNGRLVHAARIRPYAGPTPVFADPNVRYIGVWIVDSHNVDVIAKADFERRVRLTSVTPPPCGAISWWRIGKRKRCIDSLRVLSVDG